MPIPDSTIDEIRERVDLVEIASEYLDLKKTGENFKALCPFHVEKTASFVISQKKQIFHCFGCGVGGNLFTFLMKMENIEFSEAIRRLARRCGVTLPTSSWSDAEKEELYQINELAKDFYSQNLHSKEGKPVLKYLHQRGLNTESIKSFGLGYAPKGWEEFRDLAVEKGFSLSQIEKAGLIIKREQTSGVKVDDYYDRFRERLIFPIHNLQGRVIGFGARILTEGTPKYINSPQTPIYNKSQILYGMNLAKAAIREAQEAIIVEGYTDVIISHQCGFGNVVGTCGTALTQDHARILSRFGRGVILVFDPDPAGIKATLRGLDILIEEGLSVKVVELSQGLDPADFLIKEGGAHFRKLLTSAQRLFAYRLSKALEGVDLSSPEGKAGVIEEVIPTIIKTKDPIQQHAAIKELAEELRLNEEIILSEVRVKRKGGKDIPTQLKEYLKNEQRGIIECERGLIGLMLLDEGIRQVAWDELGDGEFIDPLARKVAEFLKNSTSGEEQLRAEKVFDQLNEEERSILSALILREDGKKDRLRLMRAYINRIRQNRLNLGIRELKKRIDQAERSKDDTGLKSLLAQYQILVKEAKLLGQRV